MATRDKLIQVTDLKKHYKMGTIKALDGVTTDIYRGDVMVVIGPSGSGKSTFLRSLNLLEADRRSDHLRRCGHHKEKVQGCRRKDSKAGH